jgi:hypothetical protein
MEHGNKKKMPGGGMMVVKKMPGGGMKKEMMAQKGMKMPMYMYGGKVYGEKGAMLKAILKDPAQRSMAKKELGMK